MFKNSKSKLTQVVWRFGILKGDAVTCVFYTSVLVIKESIVNHGIMTCSKYRVQWRSYALSNLTFSPLQTALVQSKTTKRTVHCSYSVLIERVMEVA